MNGSALRAAHLLNPTTARGVVVAFDHGSNGVIAGGENPTAMLRKLVSSGAEGVLLGPGLARHVIPLLCRPGAPRLIIALDAPFFGAEPGTSEPLSGQRRILSAEAALEMGATAAKILLPLGLGDRGIYADGLALIAKTAEECQRVGLPLMVEPAFWGPHVTMTDELIAHAARASVEFGADLLKVPAPRDPSVLADIVTWSPVPVYVLGGDPADARKLAEDLASWTAAGAVGVVVGRNVWSRPSPADAVRGLAAVVHNDDVEACARLLAASA